MTQLRMTTDAAECSCVWAAGKEFRAPDTEPGSDTEQRGQLHPLPKGQCFASEHDPEVRADK